MRIPILRFNSCLCFFSLVGFVSGNTGIGVALYINFSVPSFINHIILYDQRSIVFTNFSVEL